MMLLRITEMEQVALYVLIVVGINSSTICDSSKEYELVLMKLMLILRGCDEWELMVGQMDIGYLKFDFFT